VLIVPALLYALAFLFMPFSVLGVKTRLEAIEARLDDMQQDLRLLAARLPAGPQEVDFEEVYAPAAPAARRAPPVSDRPPIPPPVHDLYGADESADRGGGVRAGRRQEPTIIRAERAEPRLDRRR
jgi:hypothetical protein